MSTPICDFVRHYAESGSLRLHMPGHKGEGPLGMEQLDITEIPGADSLFEADGIIRRSEENASRLFGAETFYSAEGSSLCIRAMVHLAVLHAKAAGRTPLIAAGRNAHKAFLSAAILLDLEPLWLVPARQDSYLSCPLTAAELSAVLEENPVTAVYLTSPDYLGSMVDLAAMARVCREKNVLLLVDNAHGAYLKFLPQSLHPMDLGADVCCDSAHKTLPVLTGGAYLHLSPRHPQLAALAKDAMALYASTSPSYLILQSLDAANVHLSGAFRQELSAFLPQMDALKNRLQQKGWQLSGTEPLKLTLRPGPMGYTGEDVAAALAEKGIVCEFCDRDHIVFMLTPSLGERGLSLLEKALTALPRLSPLPQVPCFFRLPEKAMSPRAAALSSSERVPIEMAKGRILAAATVGCPPAVPPAVCGERLDEAVLEAFRLYGHTQVWVIAGPPIPKKQGRSLEFG